FFELDHIAKPSTECVVKVMKAHFGRHGIPMILRTDNGSCFTSFEFSRFTRGWNVRHITSSPNYHRSNGHAESAVKTAENILAKADKEKRDVELSLLEHRNTPT